MKIINYVFVFSITLLNLFKGSVLFEIRNIIIPLYIIYIYIGMCRLLLKKKISNKYIYIYIYIFSFILFFINSWWNNSLYFSLISLLIYLLNCLFWLIPFNDQENFDFNFFIDFNLKIGVLIIIAAIYQYFFDPSIFGFVKNEIYGNAQLLNSGKVLRRVTGLIGSPQNFSFFIGILTLVLYLLKKRGMLIFFMLGGFLSGGRAYMLFVIFMGVHYFITSRKKNKKKIIYLSIYLVPVVLFLFSKNETLSRALVFFNDWPALKIFIETIKSVDNVILGDGLGIGNRLISSITKIPRQYVSESFFVNFYAQNGLFGVLVFLSFLILISKKVWRIKRDYVILMLPIWINISFTPTFEGNAMSFYIWFLFYFILWFERKGVQCEKKN